MRSGSRILFVVNDPVFFLSHRLPLARAAKAKGYEVHVATPEEETSSEIRAEGFFFYPIPLSKHGTSLWEEVQIVRALLRLFRLLRPDLVHLVTIKPVLYGGIVARMTRIPALVSAISGMGHLFVQRGLKVSILRTFAKFLYRLALNHPMQKVVFQNADDMAYFVNAKLVDASKAVLIKGSGVDMKVFTPDPEPSGVPIILLGGRMLWEKGVAEFVEAARYLRRNSVEARFVLVGESVPWNRSSVPIEQLMSWHREGIVEWWGKKENMPDVVLQSAIVCLPSYGEGVPKFLIEAAACGRPIVTTNTPGCREIVREGINGLLVPVRDSEALARALGALLEDRGLRLEMGGAGREIAEREFSVEKVVEETFSLYGQLTSSTDRQRTDAPCI